MPSEEEKTRRVHSPRDRQCPTLECALDPPPLPLVQSLHHNQCQWWQGNRVQTVGEQNDEEEDL